MTGTGGVRPVAAGLLCLAAAVLVITLDAALTGADLATLTREGGGIETTSALLYLVAIAAFFWRAGGDGWRMWPVPVLLAAMAMREFDMDKRFTSEGILGIKIMAGDTALWEKSLAVFVWVVLMAALVVLARRTLRPYLRSLMTGAAWAVYVASALALTVVTKSIDGLARKLEPFGIGVAPAVGAGAGQIEEVLELGIPILILMAILSRYPAAALRPAQRRD